MATAAWYTCSWQAEYRQNNTIADTYRWQTEYKNTINR